MAMQLRELALDEFEARAGELGVALPIEQTAAWAALEEQIDGRTQWGCFEIVDDAAEGDGEKTRAFVSFADYATHGYHYLRAHHAPVWACAPSAEDEAEALDAIAAYVRKRDRRVAFVRLSVAAELPATRPVLSGIPYDRTVIVDVTGGDEAVLARFKPRGRRDVRKGLREAPVTCADETEAAAADFAPYYSVMVDTASRDGFVPAPASDYQRMIRTLGPEHCRVFAARQNDTGEVVAWAIDTVSGTRGVRYYAASSSSGVGRKNVADVLLYFEACELGRLGCTDFDLMAIGSDFSPTLLGLNEFKCKFAPEVAEVAPDRDLPVKKTFYGTLQAIQGVRRARREASEAKAAEAEKAPREDLLPVIVGGDVSAYAYGRMFHEAFGVQSVAVNTGFVAAVERSQIFSVSPVPSLKPEVLLSAITRIAKDAPEKHAVVVPTTDALVAALVEVAGRMPSNVVLPIPVAEAFGRACSKVAFAEACEKLGLRTPETCELRVGEGAAAPVDLPFPVVVKPAVSAEYSALYSKGFKKVYAVESQEALDTLASELAAAGFAGTMLVQELIAGDDTHMGALTFYAGTDSGFQAFGAAQTLLEDHAPTMRGNAVAMIARVWPELMEQAQALVRELGYTGLGEIDVKRDARTGEWVFFELNPRAGRNSYYMAAAGVNPMRAMVTDLVDGKAPKKPYVADEPALYTLVPLSLVKKYVRDPGLLTEVVELEKKGCVFDPQRYGVEQDLRRQIQVDLTEKNQIRKFAKFYPAPTDSSF